jgi:hypothetical protein
MQLHDLAVPIGRRPKTGGMFYPSDGGEAESSLGKLEDGRAEAVVGAASGEGSTRSTGCIGELRLDCEVEGALIKDGAITDRLDGESFWRAHGKRRERVS